MLMGLRFANSARLYTTMEVHASCLASCVLCLTLHCRAPAPAIHRRYRVKLSAATGANFTLEATQAEGAEVYLLSFVDTDDRFKAPIQYATSSVARMAAEISWFSGLTHTEFVVLKDGAAVRRAPRCIPALHHCLAGPCLAPGSGSHCTCDFGGAHRSPCWS